MLGGLLMVVGVALAGAGLRLATSRPRPIDLGGGLLAALGVLMALLGVGRLLSPVFFS